jgi:hypothetical protein
LLAVTLACGLGGPAVARADDGVTLTRFKLPDRAALDELNKLGADLAEDVTPAPDGSLYADIVVTPQEKAMYQAMGDQPVQTLQDEATAEQNVRDRNAALKEERDAMANLDAGRRVASAKSAAAASDVVRAQRADYFENYAGRFLSVEGTTTDAAVTCQIVNGRNRCNYSGPQLTAAWFDAQGNQLGSGNLNAFLDTDQSQQPPYYLYHSTLYRVGNLNDGGTMPDSVRIASANGGTDTIKVKPWVSSAGSGQFPNGFQKDFNTHYVDPQEAMQRIRDLAATYPNISELVKLPNTTPGYQRNSQAIVGTATPYDPGTLLTRVGTVASAQQPSAVVVTSRLMGQTGGNNESITLVNPNAASAPLAVSVTGNDITVNLATDATGAISSKATDVVQALNADPAASALVTATTFGTTNGTGTVSATAKTMLSDFLKAPTTYPRGPQQPYMLRIGAHRDGSRTGIFIYCQEHAREWATPLVCLETAQRLLANYGTDPETTKLVDNLDIFLIPVINMDGAAFSMYDFNLQRRNMVNYCPAATGDPTERDMWGVDLNRNFSVGSFSDGYVGASDNCLSDVFAGPAELSEPEVRNETWVQSTFPNIRFAMNIHSYGGYFMWPPGAYKDDHLRTTLPYPSYGTLQYFQQTADSVLDRIKSYRNTVVLPSRTGPVADVLYSAAGNSADEAYYTHGIIGYDFEVGADRFTSNTTGTGQSLVNFQPPYANEGHDEGMEFANGNYALLESALDYQNDTTPPTITPVSSTGSDISATPYTVTFNQSEAADIYYTLDGSAPTTGSLHWTSPRPRALPLPISIGGTTTIRWLAIDFKGNRSTGSKTFYIGTQAPGGVSGSVPATLALSLGSAPSFGGFTPGVGKDYTAGGTATVLSTAGDAALSVSDPSTTAPGHLVNGAFWLPSALQAAAASTGGTGAPTATVSGAPATLETWSAPVSNDAVALTFTQHIGQTDPLRTGTYSKTLTFTLSTTNP